MIKYKYKYKPIYLSMYYNNRYYTEILLLKYIDENIDYYEYIKEIIKGFLNNFNFKKDYIKDLYINYNNNFLKFPELSDYDLTIEDEEFDEQYNLSYI